MDTLKAYLQLSLANASIDFVKRALAQYSSLSNFFEDTKHWRTLGLTAKQVDRLMNVKTSAIEKALVWSSQHDQHIISFFDDRYPPLLKQINDPPLLIYAWGDVVCLSQACIAVVGTRVPSKEGVYNARYFSGYLAKCGFVISSGMALGVDGYAHQGALAMGRKTVAVLGSGLLKVYPKAHQTLFEQIKESGAVISEYPLDTPPVAKNFPRRNRIISGLSLGTLVVQGKEKSGSLISARLAAQQGRHVWAIPGSIYQTLSKGAHYLIREGAILVDEPQQIVDDLAQNGLVDARQVACEKPNKKAIDPQHLKAHPVLHHISDSPLDVDQLVLASHLAVDQVLTSLTVLEMLGVVERVDQGYILQHVPSGNG